MPFRQPLCGPLSLLLLTTASTGGQLTPRRGPAKVPPHPLLTLHTEPWYCFHVCFSPDGRLLATGDWETPIVQLWDAESGHQLLQLTNAVSRPTWSLRFVSGPGHGLVLIRTAGDFDTPQDGISLWSIESTRDRP